MKIKLYAFGRELGGYWEVPENTTPTFDLVLHQPVTAIGGFSGEKIGEIPTMAARCTFEWIGKYEGLEKDAARIYVLRDISKL